MFSRMSKLLFWWKCFQIMADKQDFHWNLLKFDCDCCTPKKRFQTTWQHDFYLFIAILNCISSITHMRRGTLINARQRLTQTRRNHWIKSLFCFLCAKKYSCSFIKLRLNHWCHKDYFNDVLTMFLGLERGSCAAVYAGSESSQISSKYLNLCSEDEKRCD